MNTSSMGAVGMRATGDKKAAQAFIENSKKNGLAETQAIEIENLKNEVRRLTEQVKEVGALADKKDSTLHVKK
jgi:D-serine dehydratase